jgi:hypothetical protein
MAWLSLLIVKALWKKRKKSTSIEMVESFGRKDSAQYPVAEKTENLL